jgi:hypothetical protein
MGRLFRVTRTPEGRRLLFLAALLEWVLGSYSAAFERIEQRLEEFDIQAVPASGDRGKRFRQERRSSYAKA